MRHIKTLDEALEIMTLAERQKSCAITDPNQPDNPIVYVTPEFETHTGYRREEVLGRNCRFLQGVDTDPITVGKIRNAIDRMLPIEVEILNYRKNGAPFWNNLSLRPVFSEVGKLTSFVAAQTHPGDRRAARQRRSGYNANRGNINSAFPRFTAARPESLNPSQASKPFVSSVTTFGEI